MNCPPAKSNLRGCRQQRSKGLDCSLTCFCANRMKVRAIIGLGLTARGACLGLWFEAHNARLGVLNIVLVHFALLPRLLPFMVVSSHRIFSLSFGRSRGHSLSQPLFLC